MESVVEPVSFRQKLANQKWEKIFTQFDQGHNFGRHIYSVQGAILGPIAYFKLKLWSKGLLILAALILIRAISLPLGLTSKTTLFQMYLMSACWCGLNLNRDYYKLVVRDETIWPGFTIFKKPWAAGLAVAASIVIGIACAYSLLPPQILTDVSGVWTDNSMVVRLDVAGSTKSVTINENVVPVTVKAVDADNDVVVLQSSINRKLMTFRQVWDDDRKSFDLNLSVGDKLVTKLYYQRPL